MNILYAITFLHFGAGRALLDLAKESLHRGHKATIIATERVDQFFSQPNLIEEAKSCGIKVFLYEDLFTRDFYRVSKCIDEIKNLLAKNSFDLIHSHAAMPAFAVSTAVKEVYGKCIPHISTMHAWGQTKPAWMKWQDTMMLNHVDIVHAVSHDVAHYLVDEGVKKEKIKVVYNGCDFSRIEQLRKEEVDTSRKKKYRICTVSDLSERKGTKYLIEAMAKLPDWLADHTELIIIGDGPEREKLEAMIQDLELEGRIVFKGFTSNPYPHIQSSDLFVLPSLSEGLPVVLVEAMYLKVPVIATDVQGNREIVNKNNYGTLVPTKNPDELAQAIVDFFINSKEFLVRVTNGHEMVVQNFDRKVCFDQMFNLYDSLFVKR